MPLENGEKKIDLYFQHGWGFDAGCWQNFVHDDLQRYKAELSSSPAQTKLMPLWYKAELSSSPAQTKLMPLWYKAELSSSPAQTKLMPLRYKTFYADRGYFGGKSIVDVRSASGFTVTICHSLGLHLIAQQQLQKTDLLVVMAGFKFFHGEEESDGIFSRHHVSRMLTNLQKDPIALLNKFYQDCSYSESMANMSPVNGKRLNDDLLLLDNHRLDLAKLGHIPQVLILHGNRDRVVPLKRGLYLSDSLGNASFMEIDGAGHGLIFSHGRQCWQIIATAINELE